MPISISIENLIKTNIELWHKATKVKDLEGKIRTNLSMNPEERVNHFFEVRKLNALRSKVRWEIDELIGSGANETKIAYYTGDKDVDI